MMKLPSRISRSYTRVICGAIFVLALGAAPCIAAQDGRYNATGDSAVIGTLNAGDVVATHEADGSAQKLAEAKDSSGNYRLEWRWHFGTVAAAEGFQLRLTAQATSSKQGMDFYTFQLQTGDNNWTDLGTADQTTMSSYAWDLPLPPTGGDVTIRAVDSNTEDDPRRSNQLWLDQLVIVALVDDPGGGGGGTGGGGGGGDTSSGPATDRIIAGYYPSWAIYSAREYWVRYIPFDRVTHVYYAFANLDPTTHEVVIGDAFAELTNRKDPETGNGLPAGNLHQLTHFRDVGHNGPAYPHLKVIISVGGWSWSGNFSDAAATPESRWRFASSLRDFVDTYGLDGADIDWEFPTGDPDYCGLAGNGCRPEDPQNHALLLMACRIMLGDDKELSIAMPTGAHSIARILPPLVDNSYLDGAVIMRNPANDADSVIVQSDSPTAADMLNYIHVMNYDNVGAAFEDTTRHHAPLYGYEGPSGDPAAGDPAKKALTRSNGHFAIQAYRHVRSDYLDFDPDQPGTPPDGIPAEKLTLGIPMYGRGFQSVDAGSWGGFEGLFQFTDDSERRRTPKGTWDGGKWGNTGVFAYWDLLLGIGGDAEVGPLVHAVGPFEEGGRFYGNYLLDGDLFVGFDNLDAVTRKVVYAVEQDLAGVMFWDFPGDVSEAQIAQGINGAGAAWPDKSLIQRIAETLETHAPQTP